MDETFMLIWRSEGLFTVLNVTAGDGDPTILACELLDECEARGVSPESLHSAIWRARSGDAAQTIAELRLELREAQVERALMASQLVALGGELLAARVPA